MKAAPARYRRSDNMAPNTTMEVTAPGMSTSTPSAVAKTSLDELEFRQLIPKRISSSRKAEMIMARDIIKYSTGTPLGPHEARRPIQEMLNGHDHQFWTLARAWRVVNDLVRIGWANGRIENCDAYLYIPEIGETIRFRQWFPRKRR
jgi:hypothetical protein